MAPRRAGKLRFPAARPWAGGRPVAGSTRVCRPQRRWPVDDAGEELRRYPLLRTAADQRRQRRQAGRCLHLLDRREQGPGGGAPGGEQHHVPGHPVPEHRLCARPHQARRPAQMVIQAASGNRLARRRVLRRREPRRGVLGRQDRVQHARRKHHRARRQQWENVVEDASSRTSTRARPSPWLRWS